MNFQKHKFQKLPSSLQHRKCAELLRLLYEEWLENNEAIPLQDKYRNFLSWMLLSPFEISSIKILSDRYHWHLNQGSILLKEHNLLPSIRRGDRAPKEDFAPIAIFLDNLRSAYNVGSILRTTEALRIGSLYFSGSTPLIDNPKVKKTSMGTDRLVPCFANSTLSKLPRPFIALETAEGAFSASSFIFPEQFTLILGNEEVGISDASLQQVNYCIDIPLFGRKNSINVACAYAICAQEIRRQRALRR